MPGRREGGGGGGGRIDPMFIAGGGNGGSILETPTTVGGGGNCEGRVGNPFGTTSKPGGFVTLFGPLSVFLLASLGSFLSNSNTDISNLLTFIVLGSSTFDIFTISVFI